MPLGPIELLLAGSAGVAVGTWAIVVPYRLALTESKHIYLIPPVLLAIAAFLPTAVLIASGERELLADSPLSRILIGVYLAGTATTVLFAPGRPREDDRLLWVLLALWFLAGLSDFNAGLPIGRLSFWVVPVVLIAAWRLRPEYEDAMRMLAWVCLAVSAASLVLAYLTPDAAFMGDSRIAHIFSGERLAGITEHPNALGLFSAFGALLWWRRSWMAFGLCALALYASDSRTAWFALVAALIVLFAGQRRPFSLGQLFWGGLLLAGAAWLLLTYAAPDQGEHLTFTGRTEVWEFVGDRWSESPLIGHGPDIWQSLISARQVEDWVGQAHNQFFQTLYTMGLAGVALLLLLVWFWAVSARRFARHGDLLPLALLATWVVYALFESPLTVNAINADLWLLAMLVFLRPSRTT